MHASLNCSYKLNRTLHSAAQRGVEEEMDQRAGTGRDYSHEISALPSMATPYIFSSFRAEGLGSAFKKYCSHDVTRLYSFNCFPSLSTSLLKIAQTYRSDSAAP